MTNSNGVLEVLRLFNVLEKVDGRKKLQKIVHILQSLGHPFPQYFGYLHYGPYSSELAAEINSLKGSDLVTETGGGGEFESYQYEKGPGLVRLLTDLKMTGRPNWESIACTLNKENPNFLEAVSTILYLQRLHGTASIERQFKALKPHLSRQFSRAMDFATELRRVSKTN